MLAIAFEVYNQYINSSIFIDVSQTIYLHLATVPPQEEYPDNTAVLPRDRLPPVQEQLQIIFNMMDTKKTEEQIICSSAI